MCVQGNNTCFKIYETKKKNNSFYPNNYNQLLVTLVSFETLELDKIFLQTGHVEI